MSRSFAGEKTPAKASFLLTLKEDQQGRKVNGNKVKMGKLIIVK